LLSVEQYREFALPYERKIVEAVHATGPTPSAGS
jgi:uroporphyrinogen-III decarboxylase